MNADKTISRLRKQRDSIIKKLHAKENQYRAIKDALEGLLGFLDAYPHEYAEDISGYVEAAQEALGTQPERTGEGR